MRIFVFLFLLFFPFLSLSGAIVQINGKWSDNKYAPTLPLSEHFDLGCKLMGEKKWEEALRNFLVITLHFENSPFYKDSLFYAGVCYFNLSEFELANTQLSTYLNLGSSLQHFEKVMELKYEIANAFAKGSRKHLFGFKPLPKWASAREDAVTLYDEVISSLPTKEIALNSLYGKAEVLRLQRKYKESIETLSILIRRFPKHSLAADSYLKISEIYLEQSGSESQNPDLIGLAKVNLQRFQRHFPADERVKGAAQNFADMQEVYAQALYEVGQFYERKKKPKASSIYYQEALKRYPDSPSAKKCHQRLNEIAQKHSHR